MLTALVNGETVRANAELKDKGLSFCCRDNNCVHPELELVIGRGIRIPHFRHKRQGNCGCSDGETDWHLSWKSQFENIEVDMGIDPVTEERNRADAVVGKDFVIEFQHSHINENEQSSRERFYGSKGGMVWIVDASGKQNRTRLAKTQGTNRFVPCLKPPFDKGGYWRLTSDDKVLPKLWIRRNVGIVFDYGTDINLLYVLPQRGRNSEYALCQWFKRDVLIKELKGNQDAFRFSEYELIEQYEAVKREEEQRKQEKVRMHKMFEDAYAKAYQRQQGIPYGKLALEIVIGTNYVVGADAIVYEVQKDGRFYAVENLRPRPPMHENRRRSTFRL